MRVGFIGLGNVGGKLASTLVRNGVDYMEVAPWVLLIPGAFLAVVLLAFNFLGDGLRDVIDSRHGQ